MNVSLVVFDLIGQIIQQHHIVSCLLLYYRIVAARNHVVLAEIY